jgi:phosphoglycolate phosphatase
MSSLPRAVVFDLDGTLVDTAPDLTAALNHVLPRVDRGPVTVEAVRTMVGQGLRKLIERSLAATGGIPDNADIEAMFSGAFEFYRDHLTDQSIPFPAARNVLDHLTNDGVTLGVCTNKPIALSEILLEELNLIGYFAAILGGDSLDVKKPEAEHLLTTLAHMNAKAEDAVMIGDSQADIEAARAAAVPVVAVSYGYTMIPVNELGADAIIDHLADLPETLLQFT